MSIKAGSSTDEARALTERELINEILKKDMNLKRIEDLLGRLVSYRMLNEDIDVMLLVTDKGIINEKTLGYTGR